METCITCRERGPLKLSIIPSEYLSWRDFPMFFFSVCRPCQKLAHIRRQKHMDFLLGLTPRQLLLESMQRWSLTTQEILQGWTKLNLDDRFSSFRQIKEAVPQWDGTFDGAIGHRSKSKPIIVLARHFEELGCEEIKENIELAKWAFPSYDGTKASAVEILSRRQKGCWKAGITIEDNTKEELYDFWWRKIRPLLSYLNPKMSDRIKTYKESFIK